MLERIEWTQNESLTITAVHNYSYPAHGETRAEFVWVTDNRHFKTVIWARDENSRLTLFTERDEFSGEIVNRDSRTYDELGRLAIRQVNTPDDSWIDTFQFECAQKSQLKASPEALIHSIVTSDATAIGISTSWIPSTIE